MGSEPGIWVLEHTRTLAFSSNLPPTGSAPLALTWGLSPRQELGTEVRPRGS